MQRASVRVETAIQIERPPQSVFDYVTTPALWHTWHAATARWLHREERGSASLAPRTRGEGRGEGLTSSSVFRCFSSRARDCFVWPLLAVTRNFTPAVSA
jgi:uncharacterized protein YndB with AHSA1/START domain